MQHILYFTECDAWYNKNTVQEEVRSIKYVGMMRTHHQSAERIVHSFVCTYVLVQL
jgi:hypothetical protein